LKIKDLFTELTPVKNISGGSGAETWIVKNLENKVFVRKFAAGDAGQRLKAQARWFHDFKGRIYCPLVLGEGSHGDYYYYDMNYLSPSETLSQKILQDDNPHLTANISLALAEFKLIFDHLTPQTDSADRRQYVQEKLLKNLNDARTLDPQFNELAAAKELIINGVAYRGLQSLLDDPRIKSTISAVDEEELFSTGHGDLTLSNLLVIDETIAFTDPNPDFKFISQEQEYSKILQSTIVKYELFNKMDFSLNSGPTINYSVGPVRDFTSTNEQILNGEAFKGLKLDALFFHLAVHLARILPYIKPAAKYKSYVYFAEIIKLLSAIASGRYNLA